MLILVQGHETTTNLIANGVWCLLSNPDQFELIKQTRQLLSSAIEEILRFESPARIAIRFASEDMELKGASIKCGDRIGLVVASANHDPEVRSSRCIFGRKKNGTKFVFRFWYPLLFGRSVGSR
jgi:cytochrome P450